MNPGAMTLHNSPRAMQHLVEIDGTEVDLAALDLMRTRERGVPRYNQFRQLLHKPPIKRFEDISDNPNWVAEIRAVYKGALDAVDLMVGLFAEPLPPGFGFSSTSFLIFILLSPRPLNSDRLFSVDLTP